MTERLYYADTYLKQFEAEIVAVGEDGRTVALDRSAFFPGGGGQPGDTGKFIIQNEIYEVTDSFAGGEFIWHRLNKVVPANFKGYPLQAGLDWERRYAHMRHHTALHILNGVAYLSFGALITGAQVYADRARIDLTLEDLSQDKVELLEKESNAAIAKNLETRPLWVSQDEAAEMPELIRTLKAMPPQSEKMRVMEIVGLDRQFCGGTHVTNLGDVGSLKIVGTRSKGKVNKRLEIALE